MEVVLIMGIAIGFYAGFVVGRAWTERSRARFDGGSAWTSRKRYRGTRPF